MRTKSETTLAGCDWIFICRHERRRTSQRRFERCHVVSCAARSVSVFFATRISALCCRSCPRRFCRSATVVRDSQVTIVNFERLGFGQLRNGCNLLRCWHCHSPPLCL